MPQPEGTVLGHPFLQASPAANEGLVDHFGERVMLSASYVGLIFVFAGYALIDHRPTLYTLYCIDNLIFFGSIFFY